MNAAAAVHVVCAVAALVCSGLLVVAAVRRTSDRFPFAVYAAGTLSAASWSGHVAWFEVAGASAGQLFWLPSVGLAAAAALFWTRLVVQPDWSPGLGWVAVVFIEPLGVLAARLFLGTDVLVTYEDGVVRFGWVFAVHSVYCFVLLVATVAAAAPRWNDAIPQVQAAMRILAVGAVGAIAAEALRLQLTDVVVVATMVTVAGAALSAPPGALTPRPAPGVLVDHVGALVLVLDGGGRLLDLNGPAKAFFAAHGAEAPATGDDLTDTFRVLLDAPLADAPLELDVAGTRVAMQGRAERFGADASAGSWVVVLRHRAAAFASASAFDDHADQDGWDESLSRLSEHGDPAADVVAMGLLFIDHDDAVRAANALRYVAGSLEAAAVAVGVAVSGAVVVVVAPRHLEGLLADVAGEWRAPRQGAGSDGEEREGVRIVSFAPSLARRPVVRHGRVDSTAGLVASVRQELAASSG